MCKNVFEQEQGDRLLWVSHLAARGAVVRELEGKCSYQAEALVYAIVDCLYKASYADSAFPDNAALYEKLVELYNMFYPDGVEKPEGEE